MGPQKLAANPLAQCRPDTGQATAGHGSNNGVASIRHLESSMPFPQNKHHHQLLLGAATIFRTNNPQTCSRGTIVTVVSVAGCESVPHWDRCWEHVLPIMGLRKGNASVGKSEGLKEEGWGIVQSIGIGLWWDSG